MLSKPIEKEDIKAIRLALRAKNKAQVELNMLMVNLQEKYDFCIEAGDNINIVKGVITYAGADNPVESVDSQ